MYIMVLLIALTLFYLGISYGYHTWRGTAVYQINAKDGVYSVIGTIDKLDIAKTIVIAERHDGKIYCLILENNPQVKVFKIKDGHVRPFNS